MRKPYVKYVYELMAEQAIGKPIYLSEISTRVAESYDIPLKKAAGAVSVACKRIVDGKMIPELRSYQKGIYFRTALTLFGEIDIDKEQLIEDKYLKNDSGYETGLFVLHRLGLTSQLPNERVLATNRASDCARLDRKLGVVIRPPKVSVDAGNKQYLKILDMLDIIDDAPVDVDNPYSIIGEYIEQLKLEYVKLLAFADKYYNKNTIIRLAHVAGEKSGIEP